MIPTHRDALFLRMAELLQQFAAFGMDEGERKKVRDGWLEIAPGVEYEAWQIHDVIVIAVSGATSEEA